MANAMTFPQAMQKVLEGKAVRRLAWASVSPNDSVRLYGGWLCIFRPDGWHTWVICDWDMIAEDWVVYEADGEWRAA